MQKKLSFAQCYIDDLIILSNTPQEYVRHLPIVLEQLCNWGLRLNHRNCNFFHNHLHYLGCMILFRRIWGTKIKGKTLQNIPLLTMFHNFVYSLDLQTNIVNL